MFSFVVFNSCTIFEKSREQGYEANDEWQKLSVVMSVRRALKTSACLEAQAEAASRALSYS